MNSINFLLKTLKENERMEQFLILCHQNPEKARQYEVRRGTSFLGVFNPWLHKTITGDDIIRALDRGEWTIASLLTRVRQAKAKCYQDIAYYETSFRQPPARWWFNH